MAEDEMVGTWRLELLSNELDNSGTDVGGTLLAASRTELLEMEVAELCDLNVGRAILERLDDDGEELIGSRELDLAGGTTSSSSDSTK
jgi:hypothetical protein